jgi:diadenosine tetraphosphate (Ap4A) HIT family hydrolase
MSESDQQERQQIDARCQQLIAQGICPTCQDFQNGDVFRQQEQRMYYQDAVVTVLLEQFPRGIGHTIILTNNHYADLTELPLHLGPQVMRITQLLAQTIKQVVGAEKVYLVTMCSGVINHFHMQLIPRLPGEMIGGRVFSTPRSVLHNYEPLRTQLTATFAHLQAETNSE